MSPGAATRHTPAKVRSLRTDPSRVDLRDDRTDA